MARAAGPAWSDEHDLVFRDDLGDVVNAGVHPKVVSERLGHATVERLRAEPGFGPECGRMRERARTVEGMRMAWRIRWQRVVPALAISLLAGCSPGPTEVETLSPTVTTMTSSTAGPDSSTRSTLVSSTPRAGNEAGEQAWSEIDAERTAINYLAALAAGAFDQAAWPIENNGAAIDGQAADETAGEALERLCANDVCKGPYTVKADGPGLTDPVSSQASSTVTVTHVASGEQRTLALGTFEGQLMVTGLPPAIASSGEPTLMESLFGEHPPTHVVVARHDAFELWQDGQTEWVTNWWADDTTQIEGDILAGHQLLASVSDPRTTLKAECPRLMSRNGAVLALDQCDTSSWHLFDASSGATAEAPVPFEERGDGENVWFTERGGTTVSGLGDAEGNLTTLSNQAGLDLLGDGYAGDVALSTDGALIAYVDHHDPAALSHFWSAVVVIVDTSTSDELGRWTLDNPILNLEFAQNWLVAAEADPDGIAEGTPEQVALTAINVVTGAVTRSETPVRLFLP